MSTIILPKLVGLKIQKLDRRMTGHQYFKYRLEFPYHAFSAIGGFQAEAFRMRAQTFYDFFKHLTEVYGVGPEVDDTAIFSLAYKTEPQWGFRLVTNNHTYAVYVTEEARIEVEKLLVFKQLQAV